MVISQTAEYALRAVLWLATQGDRAIGTAQIARATCVPAGYLSKVLQALARAGLVQSAPGRSGGFRLTGPPAGLSVLAVVRAVEPVQRIETCPLGLKTHGVNLCPLHRRLDNAMALVEKALSESTIAELLMEPSASKPLCEIVEGSATLRIVTER